ncbi:MAG: sulfite exporter TauE/SafE family protein [Bacteriovoracaceae bacterium]|nr:sulfite exporter TauE/SafE family protein [Bacteriovoracaceae bacterium]
MLFLLLFVIGLSVGFVSAFFGIGGGAVAVPLLYWIFPDIGPQVIIGSSLGMIFVNSLVNTYNFRKMGRIADKKLYLPIGVFIIVGVLLGEKLALVLTPKSIKIIFGVSLIVMALKSMFAKVVKDDSTEWKFEVSFMLILKAGIASLLGGVIAGVTGLGGGVVLVPLFITVLHMPFFWVPVYSNIAMAMGTCAGVTGYMLVSMPKPPFAPDSFFGYLQVGSVNWGIIVSLLAGALISSKLGAHSSQKIPQKYAKWLFVTLLSLLAIKMLLTA